MSLKGQIQDDIKTAMKAGEKDRLKVLRLVSAAIKQVEVDERKELDDVAVLGILNKMVKQRRDSITQYTDGNRQDLADIEAAEIAIIETYLPTKLTEDELEEMIDEAIAQSGAENIRDMGKVMGMIKTKAAGRADMGTVGAMVKERLG
jgi:uncharacterized protein YqeY